MNPSFKQEVTMSDEPQATSKHEKQPKAGKRNERRVTSDETLQYMQETQILFSGVAGIFL